MEVRELEKNYRFRPARPNRLVQRMLAFLPRYIARRMYRVEAIEVRGEEHVRAALAETSSLMFTINHPAHGDPFIIVEAMNRLRVDCNYVASWHVFTGWLGLKGWAFQRLGAFSIDREGTDLRAFRAAVDTLTEGHRSLVIFPEGDVYHLNDRLTPLRDGAAMIALTAAKRRAKQKKPPVLCVPCGLKYFYLTDPTPQLETVMTQLELRLYWRPREGVPLPERIHMYAHALLSLKELEYLGRPGEGPLTERTRHLTEHVLSTIESRRLDRTGDGTVPERIKLLRHEVIAELGGDDEVDDSNEQTAGPGSDSLSPGTIAAAQRDFDDLHLATQLFSYPGDYLRKDPTIERLAETIDKFEEDALGVECAGARAPRRAVVQFGPAVRIEPPTRGARGAAGTLTGEIERAIQEQINTAAREPGE